MAFSDFDHGELGAGSALQFAWVGGSGGQASQGIYPTGGQQLRAGEGGWLESDYGRCWHGSKPLTTFGMNIASYHTFKSSYSGGEYYQIAAGNVIDQYQLGSIYNIGGNNQAKPSMILAAKTESAASGAPGLIINVSGYYLEYYVDRADSTFKLALVYRGGTGGSGGSLRTIISNPYGSNGEVKGLRMVVTDETTQDRIQVYEETTIGEQDWNLLHNTTIGTASTYYVPWGNATQSGNGMVEGLIGEAFVSAHGAAQVVRYAYGISVYPA